MTNRQLQWNHFIHNNSLSIPDWILECQHDDVITWKGFPQLLALFELSPPVTDRFPIKNVKYHYNDVIMSAMASQVTSLTIVYSTVYPGVNQRKHQSSESMAAVRGIHRWPVNSPHKGPVTRDDDVILTAEYWCFFDVSLIKLWNK